MTARSSRAGALLRLCPPCAAAVLRAGEAVLEVYRTDFGVQPKADRSPVTEADFRSSRVLVSALGALPGRPLPVLSEEEAHAPWAERGRWRRFWLVDPLDGTKEFVQRNGEFTINVALIERGVPVLGLVYAPISDLLYFGGAETGSFRLEGARQRSSAGPAALAARAFLREAARLAPAGPPAAPGPDARSGGRIRVLGSRSHSTPRFEEYLDELRREYREVEVVLMGGSLKFCLVAEGRADIYPRFGRTMEWDTAAPHAVLRGVGRGVYSADSGEELRYNKEDLANGPFIAR